MTMSEPLPPGGWVEEVLPLTWSPVVSPASPFRSPDSARRRTTSGGFGRRSPESFATFDPDARSWKTCRVYLDGEWETYSVIWPRSGMTHAGIAYLLSPSAPLTAETGYSSSLPTPTALRDAVALWPTPKATDGERGGRGDLLSMVRAGQTSRRRDRLLPTPLAKDGARGGGLTDAARLRRESNSRTGLSLPEEIGGPLNPMWVEWLMGFPAGWTDLEDSETR